MIVDLHAHYAMHLDPKYQYDRKKAKENIRKFIDSMLYKLLLLGL
jgi:hypothetical protein